MKLTFALLCLLGVITGVSHADAQTLYGATSGGHGELYILNPSSGSVIQDVGPLNDSGSANYSVTGIAFNPVTGVLFGSTGGASGTKLLTINPSNALVTVVGSFNVAGQPSATMTDIAFDSSGNLYGIGSSGGAHLYTINPSTGAATLVGNSGFAYTTGGGLAISSDGIFYGTPYPGYFGTYDSTNGAYTQIAAPASPVGAGGGYGALAFNGSVLYGINILSGSGTTHLTTIDPPTGNVTDIGPCLTHLDAIAFTAAPSSPTLVYSLVGNQLNLSWPADHVGFTLQEQMSPRTVGLTTNWNDVANSSSTNQVTLPVNPADGTAFYRLIHRP